MNWEESKALTPLKRDFLKAFFDRSQAFFLTGGSALGIFYLQHRLSFDLDFFTTDEHLQWHILDNEHTLTLSPTTYWNRSASRNSSVLSGTSNADFPKWLSRRCRPD